MILFYSYYLKYFINYLLLLELPYSFVILKESIIYNLFQFIFIQHLIMNEIYVKFWNLFFYLN